MSQVHLKENWKTDSSISSPKVSSLDVHYQYIIFIVRTEKCYEERVVLSKSADLIMFLYGAVTVKVTNIRLKL